ncbi:MAG: hypothetical protein HY272_13860 [Gammaproteobacteria bacterium]|nr:hypothetical protein [Gammaproteobacteria bacterium]
MKQIKVKVLSLSIAAILAGCGGSTPEKQADVAPSATTAAPRAASQAPTPNVATVTPPPMTPPPAQAATVEPAAAKSAPKPATSSAPMKLSSDPNTFLITAVDKDESHPNFSKGSRMGFAVNGAQGKEIAVTRGQVYKFAVDTGIQHDFYLTTSPAGWGAGTYTDGVTGQFIYQGEVAFKPDQGTPDLLYYECRNHKYMGGKIFVLNKGDSLAKAKEAAGATEEAAVSGGQRAAVVTEGAVKQKLGYADMVLKSDSSHRIESSGDAAAIGMLKQARQQIDAARASLSAGKLDQAMDQVNEGLRLVNSASRSVTTESDMAAVDHKAMYGELISALGNYDISYKRNMDRLKKSGQKPKSVLDEAAYQRLLSEGKSLGGKGDYAGANKSLHKAQAMITVVLTDMLQSQTVVYDKSFETPKDEYEFELSRLENYEELIPLAIEQKQPAERALEMIDELVKKAAQIKREGAEVAAKGDYKMAIMAMEAATSNLQRALRLAGVQ